MKVTQSCPTLCDPMDCIVYGILQARILKWVAFLFSRVSSQPRDWTQVSCIAGGFFTNWAIREACKHMHVNNVAKMTVREWEREKKKKRQREDKETQRRRRKRMNSKTLINEKKAKVNIFKEQFHLFIFGCTGSSLLHVGCLLLWKMGFRHMGFSSCSAWT